MFTARHCMASNVSFGEIPFASTIVRGVDSQAKGCITRGFGASSDFIDPGWVAMDVKLEQAQRIRGCTLNRLDSGLAYRTQHVRDTELTRRACRCGASFGSKKFQTTDRSKNDRQAQLASQERGLSRNMTHISKYARTKGEGIQCCSVATQSCFGFSAADNVVPMIVIEFLPCFLNNFVQC